MLRIFRGEDQPLPCLEIAERVIQVAPAITRIVDQLVANGLHKKTQAEHDRHVFLVQLTTAGKKVLNRVDQHITRLHDELLAGVAVADLKMLIRILECP